MDTSSSSWWKNEAARRMVLALILGQIISFIVALMSLCSSYLASHGVDAPITQSFFCYTSLALFYGGILLYRRKRLLVPWYYYLLLGIVDVEGNYLVTQAYQYSSITSVTLLDCWIIPWVIILTWIFLGTRYSLWQYIGAAICILGLGLVFLSDARVGGGGGSNPLLGDALVLAGTVFFAVTNSGEEFCIKKKDLVELMAMLGLFGSLVSMCQIIVTERESLMSIDWSTDIILGFAGYALASFLAYAAFPFVLKFSGATLFNLSLLTSDMWAVLIRIFFYKQKVDWIYYVSFASVGLGLFIYSKGEKSQVASVDANRTGVAYQPIEEESTSVSDETATSCLKA